MALTLPAGAYYQSGETEGLNERGERTRAVIIKAASFASLQTLLNGLARGAEIDDGWILASANLQRGFGDTAILTLNCSPSDTSGSGAAATQTPLDETWTLKSVRNDISILAFCGPSDSNPRRERIEAWQKEPDGTLAAANRWQKSDGSFSELYTTDLLIVNKLRKGIDTVMRFYPMLTKTRTYSTPPLTVYENLATIDTPVIGSDAQQLQKPGNLNAIISAHTWLKCQDDCTSLTDGKFQRVESWMGVPATDGTGWDANLYGSASDRWSMPLTAT